jgi:hypothetical protein
MSIVIRIIIMSYVTVSHEVQNVFVLCIISHFRIQNIDPTVQHDFHIKICLGSKFYIFFKKILFF